MPVPDGSLPPRQRQAVVGKRVGLAYNGPRVAGTAPPEWLLSQFSGPAAEKLLTLVQPAPVWHRAPNTGPVQIMRPGQPQAKGTASSTQLGAAAPSSPPSHPLHTRDDSWPPTSPVVTPELAPSERAVPERSPPEVSDVAPAGGRVGQAARISPPPAQQRSQPVLESSTCAAEGERAACQLPVSQSPYSMQGRAVQRTIAGNLLRSHCTCYV